MSSVLIINEPPLQILPSLAKRIGLNEAIVLQQIHYWTSDKRSKTVIDGRKWVYNTYEQWREQFPFWSKDTIIRTMRELKAKGIILTKDVGPLNNIVKYYSIDYQALDSLTLDTSEIVDRAPTQVATPATQLAYPAMQVAGGGYADCIPEVYIEHARVSETTQRLHTEIEDTRERVRSNPLQDSPSPLDFSVSKEKKNKKGTRLECDWILPNQWREWALHLGMMNEEIDKTAFKFKGYWLSTTKNATKMDWFRTWQNYCVKECEFKGIKLNTSKLVESVSPSQISVQIPEPQAAQQQSDDPNLQKWYDLQPKLREMVGYANYESWIERFLEIIKIDGKAVFKAKSSFASDYIMRTFGSQLMVLISHIDPNITDERDIEFIHPGQSYQIASPLRQETKDLQSAVRSPINNGAMKSLGDILGKI